MAARPTRESCKPCDQAAAPKIEVRYVSEQDARDRLAGQVLIGLTGIIRIMQDYHTAGITFAKGGIEELGRRLAELAEDSPEPVEDDPEEGEVEPLMGLDPNADIDTNPF